ncbi:MAG: gas vesicle protein [Streptosporangiales bacterium]|nr:gas vesicle protein [Streptosporangiales bacterium]
MSQAVREPAPESLAHEVSPRRDVALVDLLDRLLGAGVVLSGDVTISLAGVDLVRIKLHALVMSVRSELEDGPHE